jgi:hypothetical protein
MVAAPICSGGEPGQSATEPIWPTKQWQTSTPEEEGFFDRGSMANIDQRKEVITVQNLLDMTSGIDWMKQLPDGFASAIEMERSPIFSGPLEGVPRDDAIKGSWQDDRTFVIDRLVLGLGAPPERWTLTFAGEKLNVRANIPDRPEISIDSETGT